MSFIAATVVAATYIYYRNQNSYQDPRVAGVQKLYVQFDKERVGNNFERLLAILDQIDDVYQKVEEYRDSYELGVVDNDRSAIYLTKAIYNSADPILQRKDLLLAQKFAMHAIERYEHWAAKYDQLNSNELTREISNLFTLEIDNRDKYIQKRVRDILDARIENKRRLSVSYTNLGMSQRHLRQQELALKSYLRAIELWDKNKTAKNNLRVLLGKEPQKESIIEKFFPEKRISH